MVPVSTISDLLIIMVAARHKLSMVTLKVFKIHGLAKIFFKTFCRNPSMPEPFPLGKMCDNSPKPPPPPW